MVVNNKGVLKMNRFDNLKSNGLLSTGEDWHKHGIDFYYNNKFIAGVYYDDEDFKNKKFNVIVNDDIVFNPLKELQRMEEWVDDTLWGHKHSIQGELTEDKIKDYIFNKFIPQYGIEFI